MKPGTFVTRRGSSRRTVRSSGSASATSCARAAPWSSLDWLDRWRRGGGLVSRSYERVHNGVAVPGADLALQLRGGFVVGALACGG